MKKAKRKRSPRTPSTVDAIDTWAANNGASRSEAIRRLVEIGLRAKAK